jgi:hypothetical protein
MDSDNNDLKQRAKELADESAVNEDDEREAQEQFEQTGEPVRDRLGNASGAS